MIFLPASRLVPQPWKNGAGITREVAAFPPRSGMESFDWRVSIANVANDGPFSIFPGVDRTIIILSGEGIALEVAGRSSRLRPGEAPYSFPGDQPTGCALLGGPVMDLNVMSRRGEIAHSVIGISQPQTISVEEGILVWIKRTGRVTGPEGSFEMGPLDALKALNKGEWKLEGENFLAYYAAFTRLK
jgi:environmental stress-induced protein Ves